MLLRYLYVSGILLAALSGFALSEERWTSYDNMDCCYSLVFEGKDIWCAEGNAIVRWNGSGGSPVVYTRADGPSPGWYYCVAIDRNGVKWIGGFTGLNRFDGHSWKTFTTSDGLPGNIVRQIAVTKNNVLWIATEMGIGSYDGNTWVKHELPWEYDMLSVFVDDVDIVWVGTGKGIFRSRDGKSWELCKELPKNFRYIFSNPDGRKWLVMRDGALWELDGAEWKRNEEFSGYFITTVTCDRDGVLWYGTNNCGVLRVQGKDISNYTISDGLPSNIIHSSGQDAEGRLWFGTSLGLCCFGQSGWKPFLTGGGPISNYVRNIFVDSRNVTWVATWQGLSAFDGKRWTTDRFLAGMDVLAVSVDASCVVWASIRGGTVWRIEGDSRKRFTAVDGLPNADITSMVVDCNNTVWFGTSRRGVLSFNAGSWKNYTILDGLEDDEITAMAVDSSNVKWFGTRYGVSRFDGEKWKTFTTSDGLAHNHVNAIAVDSGGIIWFATDGGLSRFDGTSWKKMYYQSKVPCVSLVVDRNNRKWVGKAGGEVMLMESDTRKRWYLGKPSQCIAVGSNDVWWFGTPDGALMSMTDAPLAVDNPSDNPKPLSFRSSRPNPFNASTVLEFTIPVSENITLTVYNSRGQKVRELLSGRFEAGIHSIRWDGRDAGDHPVSSGMYIARLKGRSQTAALKMLLLR